MPDFDANELVDCPIEEVFRLLTDPSRVPEWEPAVTAVEVVDGGPVRVGSRLRQTCSVKGKESTTELDVLVYDPPERYTVSGVVDGEESIYRYVLETEEEGTHVWLVADVTTTVWSRLRAAVIGRKRRKQRAEQLTRLKAAAEPEPLSPEELGLW